MPHCRNSHVTAQMWKLIFKPTHHENLVLITHAQKSPLKLQADVSRGARGLNFNQSLHLHPYFKYASSKGSGECGHLRRLA